MVDELAVASMLLAAVALISCLSVGNKRAIRRMPRAAWVAAIVLVPVGGAAAWFLLGRPLSIRPGGWWRRRTGTGGPPDRMAPDDDPEFLRSLDHQPGDDGQPTTDDDGEPGSD